MEPNYENSTAAAKGCYWNERPFSNENERNTHNSTLPDINLLSTKNGLDFGVHLTVQDCSVVRETLERVRVGRAKSLIFVTMPQ